MEIVPEPWAQGKGFPSGCAIAATMILCAPADARGSVANEPGCVRFDIIRDEQNSSRIYLYEVYRNKAAFEAHMKAPYILTWQETVKVWFASHPVVGAGPSIFPPDTDWHRNWKA